MNGKRMTWKQIKKEYPNQYVGLIDVIKDPIDILTAVVCCTSNDTNEDEMHLMAFDGKISLEYTSLDECIQTGFLT